MKTKFPDYTSEEVILILNLYLKNRDVNILQQKDKRVIQISEILKEMYHKNFPKRKIPESFRSPSAIVYKMNKFRAFDEKKLVQLVNWIRLYGININQNQKQLLMKKLTQLLSGTFQGMNNFIC